MTIFLEDLLELREGEGGEFFNAYDGDARFEGEGLTLFDEVIVEFAGAKDDTFCRVEVLTLKRIAKNRLEPAG